MAEDDTIQDAQETVATDTTEVIEPHALPVKLPLTPVELAEEEERENIERFDTFGVGRTNANPPQNTPKPAPPHDTGPASPHAAAAPDPGGSAPPIKMLDIPQNAAQVRPGLKAPIPVSETPIVIDYNDIRSALDYMRSLHRLARHPGQDASYHMTVDRLRDWRALLGDKKVKSAAYFIKEINRWIPEE
jgi:hypothetical protein